jgi:hypothetical protein
LGLALPVAFDVLADPSDKLGKALFAVFVHSSLPRQAAFHVILRKEARRRQPTTASVPPSSSLHQAGRANHIADYSRVGRGRASLWWVSQTDLDVRFVSPCAVIPLCGGKVEVGKEDAQKTVAAG